MINVLQINQTQLALAIQQYASGAAFSGNITSYVAAGGWLGNNIVYVTGGDQLITGTKHFLDSPRVPYSGSTGSAPSARWVNDQIGQYSGWANATFADPSDILSSSGQLSTNLAATGSGLYTLLVNQSGQASTDYATKTALFNTGAALSKVRVTGSSTIQDANFSGIGGTNVFISGGLIVISGGAAGGGSSNTSVTGSAAISAPNFTGVGSVVLTYDGTYVRVSGIAGSDAALSGYLESYFVNRTTNQSITGIKTFVSSPLVPTAITELQAINLGQASGISGTLVARDSVISGVLYGQMTGISGAISVGGGGVTNNYYITGTGVVVASSTGVVTNTFNITSGNASVSSSGTVNNTFNGSVSTSLIVSGVTGNFVNMAYWFDPTTLATGLNAVEAMVGRSFFFTGYGIGVINTGTQGYFSGSLYQRTPTNVKTNFVNFSLNSGVFFSAAGGFSQEISGLNRVGLDIYLIGTGITGLSIGVFGVGY